MTISISKTLFCLKTAVPYGIAVFLFASNAGADDHQPTAPKVHIVKIEKFRFVPDQLTVSLGDTVKWINMDVAPHTATAVDKNWNSDRLNRSDSWSLQITIETSQDYFCAYHPQMKAKLNIEQ